MEAWRRLCAVDDVREDRPYAGAIDGVPVAVFKQEGRLFALRDLCPHERVRLSEGFLVRGAIECVLHNARFDLRTGACLSIPRYDDVRSYDLRIDGDDLLVRIGRDRDPPSESGRVNGYS